MVKEALDLSGLDVAPWQPPSTDETHVWYEDETASEVARIRAQMTDVEKQVNVTDKLVSFADNSDPVDFVVRYQAMIRVFQAAGVAEAYYEPETFPNIATLTFSDKGYKVVLRRPNRKGTFTVDFITDSVKRDEGSTDPPIGRQNVFYRRGVN